MSFDFTQGITQDDFTKSFGDKPYKELGYSRVTDPKTNEVRYFDFTGKATPIAKPEAPKQPMPGLFEQIGVKPDYFSGMAGGIKRSSSAPDANEPSELGKQLSDRIQKIKDNFSQVASGDSNAAASALSTVGNIVAIPTDIAGSAIKTLSESIMPDAMKEGAKAAIQDIASSSTVQDAVAKYKALKEAHPDVMKAVEGVMDIGSFLLNFIGLPKAAMKTAPLTAIEDSTKTAITNAGNTVADVASNAITKTGEVMSSATTKVGELAKARKEAVVNALPPKTKLQKVLTNLDENVYKRIKEPEYLRKVVDTVEKIDNGDKNLYLSVTQDVADKISSLDFDTKTAFGEIAKEYVKKGQIYDVGARVKDIVESVDSFKTGKDIALTELRNKKGQFDGFKLTKGRYSPYSASEIQNLNGLIDDIRSAKKINADQLLALDQKFSTYYNAVPLGASGAPTPYHAAVMELKDAAQTKIKDMLSGPLRDVYAKYSELSDLKTDFGNRIVDNSGQVKDGAEQFIANLVNSNKGAQVGKVNKYFNLLDVDLVRESQIINDAKKLAMNQAPSGGRLSDFLKTTVFSGLGGVVGSVLGPAGTVAGAAAGAGVGAKITSPRYQLENAIKAAEKAAKAPK